MEQEFSKPKTEILKLKSRKNYGWLETRLDSEESRIRFFKLRIPDESARGMRK